MNKCLYCYESLESGDFHEKCSRDFFGEKHAPELNYSLAQMHVLAEEIVSRSVAVPGVQPKLSLSFIRKNLENPESRLTVMGALGGNYILKPPTEHYPEMPENEHLTMRIAEAFGIRTVSSSLIRLASGELAYITKRIDRTEEGAKIHMLDMFQITDGVDKYKSSMEKVGKALNEYSQNTLLDKLKLFELVTFCFLTGNNDMHLKNFSMIRQKGFWELSPAYDLLNVYLVNPKDKEDLALTLGGKKLKLTRAYFESFGQYLGLNKKQVDGVFKRWNKNRAEAEKWIRNSFLSDGLKKNYLKLINERYERLNKEKPGSN